MSWRSHDIVLGQTTVVSLHSIDTARLNVSDVAETELTSAVLVSLELGDRSVCSLSSVETDNSGAPGPAARFVLDLRLLDVSDGAKQLDQVLVAR